MTERRDPLFDMILACTAFLSPEERLLLSERLGAVRELCGLDLEGISRILGRGLPRASWKPAQTLKIAQRALAACESRGWLWIRLGDSGYPERLVQIVQAPYMLFVRGALPAAGTRMAAMVGTRNPGMDAWKAARRVARELSEAGVCVVSGLALGIDRAAHLGALDNGGKTVAVLGSGIDAIYPRAHLGLASRILESGGAIVSEYPPGTPPRPFRFPERNRIIAGLCPVVAVAQAPARSGALITADIALREGRDVVVLSEGLEGERGEGGRRLAEEGAPVCGSAQEILSASAMGA